MTRSSEAGPLASQVNINITDLRRTVNIDQHEVSVNNYLQAQVLLFAESWSPCKQLHCP